MKIEYVNPFVEATYELIKNYVKGEIKRGDLLLKKSPLKTLGVCPTIGLTGQLEGRVMVDISRKTAIKLAELMNDSAFSGLDSLVRSSINEFANMICGKAVSVLNDRGYKFDITPPKRCSGDNLEIMDGKNVEVLVIPFKSTIGDFFVNIALREA